jgi:aryl-alcohol dehydrogenase-like predicted oxidoreductase
MAPRRHAGRRLRSDLYSSQFDRPAALQLIRRAVDRGVTLFDTAEAYGCPRRSTS